MNLLQIRTDFIKKNGRYDLVVDTTDFVDDGANFYIQAGQRILDSILPHRKSIGTYTTDLVSDQSAIILKYIRYIEKVEIILAGTKRSELARKSYSWLREQYGDDWGQKAVGMLTLTAVSTSGIVTIDSETYTFGTVDAIVTAINAGSSVATAQKYSATQILITYNTVGTVGNAIIFTTTYDTGSVDGSGFLGGTITGRANQITKGIPLYYTPILTTPHPSLNVDNIGTLDSKDILFGTDRFTQDGILIMPPANDTYTATIFANYFSRLEDDLDVSYHSEVYPDLLIIMANASIEMFYRNSTGLQDWLNSAKVILDGIDKDMIFAEMLNAGNQMRG